MSIIATAIAASKAGGPFVSAIKFGFEYRQKKINSLLTMQRHRKMQVSDDIIDSLRRTAGDDWFHVLRLAFPGKGGVSDCDIVIFNKDGSPIIDAGGVKIEGAGRAPTDRIENGQLFLHYEIFLPGDVTKLWVRTSSSTRPQASLRARDYEILPLPDSDERLWFTKRMKLVAFVSAFSGAAVFYLGELAYNVLAN